MIMRARRKLANGLMGFARWLMSDHKMALLVMALARWISPDPPEVYQKPVRERHMR